MKISVIGVAILSMGMMICGCGSSERADKRDLPQTVSRNGLVINRLGTAKLEPLNMGAIHGWMMALPSENGFAPNVNWVVQEPPKELSIQQFLDSSLKQYDQIKATVVNSKIISDTEMEMESEFVFVGTTKLHNFQRTIKNGRKFYVITATSAIDQWSKYSAQLIDCVRSAKVD